MGGRDIAHVPSLPTERGAHSTLDPIHPHEFISEYVLPAFLHYGENRLQKHLAVHAIAQMDNLAEVVVTYLLPPERSGLKRGEAGDYRKALRFKWPVLGTINDSHDCHKHGKLTRTSAISDPMGVSAGRPEQTTGYGFFVDHTEVGGDLTPYEVLAVVLNDGTQREVFELLWEALQAWENELDQLGLPRPDRL